MSQSDEELDAHFGAAGPVWAAQTWLGLVLEKQDLVQAWPLTDRNYRRELVSAWYDANTSHPLLAGTGRDQVIRELSPPQPDSRLWDLFAEVQLREIARAWAHVDLTKWGWASKPRPAAPGYEYVALVEGDGTAQVIEQDSLIPSVNLLMHHVPGQGWLVAGNAQLVG